MTRRDGDETRELLAIVAFWRTLLTCRTVVAAVVVGVVVVGSWPLESPWVLIDAAFCVVHVLCGAFTPRCQVST